jgi:hypothetical protein
MQVMDEQQAAKNAIVHNRVIKSASFRLCLFGYLEHSPQAMTVKIQYGLHAFLEHRARRRIQQSFELLDKLLNPAACLVHRIDLWNSLGLGSFSPLRAMGLDAWGFVVCKGRTHWTLL